MSVPLRPARALSRRRTVVTSSRRPFPSPPDLAGLQTRSRAVADAGVAAVAPPVLVTAAPCRVPVIHQPGTPDPAVAISRRPGPAGRDATCQRARRSARYRRRPARIPAAGRAVVQNLRRGHYEIATGCASPSPASQSAPDQRGIPIMMRAAVGWHKAIVPPGTWRLRERGTELGRGRKRVISMHAAGARDAPALQPGTSLGSGWRGPGGTVNHRLAG